MGELGEVRREGDRHRYVAKNIVIEEKHIGSIVIEELQDVPEARIVKLEIYKKIDLDKETLKQLQAYVNAIRDMQRDLGRQVVAELKIDEMSVSVGPVYTMLEEVSLVVALVMLVEASFQYRYLL